MPVRARFDLSARTCVYRPLDVAPRASAGPFRPVRPVNVCVVHLTWLHVPVPARFGLYALCTCVGHSTWLHMALPARFGLYAKCRPVDVAPRTCTGPFPPVRPVHVFVGPCTWLHQPVPARVGLYTLCTY